MGYYRAQVLLKVYVRLVPDMNLPIGAVFPFSNHRHDSGLQSLGQFWPSINDHLEIGVKHCVFVFNCCALRCAFGKTGIFTGVFGFS